MSSTPLALPQAEKLPTNLRQNERAKAAYNLCLEFEKSLQKKIPTTRSTQLPRLREDIMHCRIVGGLFFYYPSETGLETMIADINLCKNNIQGLLDLGRIYEQFLIDICKSTKHHGHQYFRCVASTQSDLTIIVQSRKGLVVLPYSPGQHPSRPFEVLRKTIYDQLVPSSRSASARKNALKRDGYRCMVTQVPDRDSVTTNEEFRKTLPKSLVDNLVRNTAYAECSHIIPISVDGFGGFEKKTMQASVTWAIISRLGFEYVPAELNGQGINGLSNIITLEKFLHDQFDSLRLWFVATDTPNRYKVILHHSMTYPNAGIRSRGKYHYVTFKSPDEAKYPLPSPDLLKIHAMCCEVACRVGITLPLFHGQ